MADLPDGKGGPHYGSMPSPITADHELASDFFRCLASPIRVAIVHALTDEPKCVHELVELLDLTQPLVSQHLRILRDNHLVARDRRGREMTYRIADHHVARIVGDALEHAAEDHHHHDSD